MKKIVAIFLLCFSLASYAQTKPAYSVAEITVVDKEGYQNILWPKLQKQLADIGAVPIVGGGRNELVAGNSQPAERIAIIKFKSYAQAKDFYASKAYQDLKPLAEKYVKIRLYIVEGE